MTFKDNTLPPLKHYQTRPLERESALRLVYRPPLTPAAYLLTDEKVAKLTQIGP
eukprot:CAMPEP_0173124174 /NCGR_PEP_ID=MMETSP1102-20130122/55475_1 /TAXON_ID=49646 /ORGANISM="Geminigera sp., Strain Caron Lab Isolate" /LENGTH=53 /DNA_ID=CAMNT_0014032423 /DNA_START=209 /DNA_END=370 /DNA_ORIENTATION=-